MEPGAISPSSSFARGDPLSLTTAGVISSFAVLARDAFLNRRPGGDSLRQGFAAAQIKCLHMIETNDTRRLCKSLTDVDVSVVAA